MITATSVCKEKKEKHTTPQGEETNPPPPHMSKTSVLTSSPDRPEERPKNPVNLTEKALTHTRFKAAKLDKLYYKLQIRRITLPFTRAIFIPLPTLFFTLLISLKHTREDSQRTVVSDRNT